MIKYAYYSGFIKKCSEFGINKHTILKYMSAMKTAEEYNKADIIENKQPVQPETVGIPESTSIPRSKEEYLKSLYDKLSKTTYVEGRARIRNDIKGTEKSLSDNDIAVQTKLPDVDISPRQAHLEILKKRLAETPVKDVYTRRLLESRIKAIESMES